MKCPKCELEIPIGPNDKRVYCACGHVFNARRGLGDIVAAWIHWATGIKPCKACDRRKAWLNRIGRYFGF